MLLADITMTCSPAKLQLHCASPLSPSPKMTPPSCGPDLADDLFNLVSTVNAKFNTAKRFALTCGMPSQFDCLNLVDVGMKSVSRAVWLIE